MLTPMLPGLPRALALLLLALASPAAAQQAPPYDAPLAQRRPADTSRTPATLRLARREPLPCGPLATRAAATLAVMGRLGRLTLEEFGALRELGGSDEAARHPVLVAMALAVAMEHYLALDEVTPARREALLDVLLSPTIPEPTCLPASTIAGVRFRVIAETCTDLENRRVEIARWAQSPSRTYLLMAHRTGEDITEDCRRALRFELGDPEVMDVSPLVPPPQAESAQVASTASTASRDGASRRAMRTSSGDDPKVGGPSGAPQAVAGGKAGTAGRASRGGHQGDTGATRTRGAEAPSGCRATTAPLPHHYRAGAAGGESSSASGSPSSRRSARRQSSVMSTPVRWAMSR
jgi:hypothetical protein